MRRRDTSGGLNEKTMRTALPAGLAASAGILTIFLGLAILGIFFSEAIRNGSCIDSYYRCDGMVMGIIMVADIDLSEIHSSNKRKISCSWPKIETSFRPSYRKLLYHKKTNQIRRE